MSGCRDLLLTFNGRVAIITINRPKKLNALTGSLYFALGELLRQIDERDDIVITILTGTGRFFSAGADVSAGSSEDNGSSENPRLAALRSFAAITLDVTRAFYQHRKILVAALNGPAVGLSAGLVALADFIYAAPHTYLLTPLSSIGSLAEGASSRTFVQRLGPSKANEALIMGKRITCDELVASGFVNEVFSPASGKQDDSAGFLREVINEVNERLGPHLNDSSILAIKELIREGERDILDHQNLLEVFAGTERFAKGIVQASFKALASGARHKL
ncbi:uncharacterized protein Z520_06536 [Fonsecaea multimorphosa CBS 102226]|uniref:Enoyl-CoA hydratase n=1 Tax=Fonsecaea multimorphosa CBS 102226 TaxID=1442371 RepID=A0A0D2KM44_9EURO|nr:uncharacterized protein Z520_06536 [Fonsecaea multimorphosa CBS 102226]KIX97758.1 hypothetical protein Z520_06536 [Fonsecaea multimorphosa CBS 102226]OAL23778.1 hypothetical protein AYO22_06097 [Fonsecaea multimorphosa]